MEIKIAEHSGFCEGVERAYRIALGTIKSGQPVFMLGNLVHNTQVIEKFKSAGVKTVKEVPDNVSGILLISAHGVAPEIYRQVEAKGLKIVDTTCPWVKKAQKLAKELADKGCQVVIIGDRGHVEVKGLKGWAQGKAVVIQDIKDIEGIEGIKGGCIGVIAQTTQAEEHFKRMVEALKARFPEIVVHNTICGATAKRQKAAVETAKQVDLMLVIGDRMSANTKRLTELCAKAGTETHQIQTKEELDKNWLKDKRTVGVTAGASTPNWVVEEVIALLRAQ